ncbi:2-dehydropantoate 2-reductase [Kroppenstedtia pulmonis]|uniref:2-dehydropantoate 2-reductase n=1 Tax=Kroppenstedtia pulmonis TaxID=1380685 RepID=A0A7D3Y0V4_9BACL|nr:2-dehydropantoate 2-reductase [Kroppenstedtia pulmonis]QKG84780.1 2-dehydropantoate 2-reductase [Kroppenstedtia pulmonis]
MVKVKRTGKEASSCMKVGIWGGGAIGLLWAARLARVIPDSWLITRTREQRDRIQEEGILLTDLKGKRLRTSVQVRCVEEELPDFDMVWVMVKHTALSQVARRMKRFCHLPAHVLLWQNGMGQEKEFTGFQHMSVNRVVHTEGALRVATNHVRHTGTGDAWVGPLSGEDASAILIPWLNRYRELPIQWDREVEIRAWEKIAINSVINPLTALWDVTNGELVEKAVFFPLMDAILKEVIQVSGNRGVDFSHAFLSRKVLDVCEKTKANYSSMQVDLSSGKKTEIDAINGQVAKMALRDGFQAPVNQALTLLIHAAENRRS